MSQILFNTLFEKNTALPFQIYGLGVDHTQEAIQRPNGLPIYQWIQCLHGSGRFYINNQEYLVDPGQGMFIHPNAGHSYHSHASSEDWIVNFICFTGHALFEWLKSTPFKESGVFTLSDPDAITQKIEAIFHPAALAPDLLSTHYSIALYDVLLHLNLYAGSSQGTSLSIQNYKLAPAITYIESNYNKPIFLDELSQMCHISPEYLCELFKKITGMRVFEYIQLTRVSRGKALLLSMPDVPLSTIGTLCGFNSVSYFIKIFKRFEHISPGEFRRQEGSRFSR